MPGTSKIRWTVQINDGKLATSIGLWNDLGRAEKRADQLERVIRKKPLAGVDLENLVVAAVPILPNTSSMLTAWVKKGNEDG